MIAILVSIVADLIFVSVLVIRIAKNEVVQTIRWYIK